MSLMTYVADADLWKLKQASDLCEEASSNVAELVQEAREGHIRELTAKICSVLERHSLIPVAVGLKSGRYALDASIVACIADGGSHTPGIG